MAMLLLVRVMAYCIVLMSPSLLFFLFKQKTAYDMRISDWSSDVCSSDLRDDQLPDPRLHHLPARALREQDDGAFRREGRDPRGRSRRCRAAARNPRDRKSVV